MPKLRDEVREHYQREAERHPAPGGLRQSVVSGAATHVGEQYRPTWIAAAIAVVLTVAIVAGLVAASHLRRSGPVPAASPRPTTSLPTTSPPTAVLPGSGSWTRLPDMSIQRMNFTATLLGSGKVLIVGGQAEIGANGGRATSSVEIYDPASRTFKKAASLGVARAGHTATLLRDGNVLVAGGYSALGFAALSSAEVYDPAADTWTAVAPMSVGRAQPAAVLLHSGRVLVVGGGDSGEAGSGTQPAGTLAESYDPALGAWQPAGNLAYGRPVYPTATVLGDGRVLVVGGRALFNSPDAGVENTEIYDPANNSWSRVPADYRTGARQDQSATLLPNGDVLIAGGAPIAQQPVSFTDLFDPRTNSWVTAPNMHDARCGQGAVLLPDGNAILIGGGCGWPDQTSRAEEYNWAANSWTAVASLSVPRGRIQAVLLADGSVLALGGMAPAGAPSPIVELFRPHGL